VQQSSLIPAPVAPAPGIDKGIADAYVGDATVTFVSQPHRAPSSDSGLWVSRHLFQGALTLHASPLIAFRMTGLSGLSQGALKTAPTLLPNPGDGVFGYGAGVLVTLPWDPHRLLLSLHVDVLSIPSFVQSACESSCDPAERITDSRHDRDEVVRSVVTAGYGYRFNHLLGAQLTLTFQNHPTNREAFESDSRDAEIHTGPIYVTAAVGVEWTPVEWLGVAPLLQWPLTRSPIEYGPIIGLGVRGIVPRSLVEN
jgi:hypothetical protein